MFQILFGYHKENVNEKFLKTVAIRCSNCGKSTGISMKNMNSNYNYIITQFFLNIMLHHVGMSWKIGTNQQLKYYIDKHNPVWITSVPQYNTSICKKVHGALFENYIRNSRTYRYKLMCSIDAYEKQQSSSVDDVNIGGGNTFPSNSTT